ncbi:unnamed protein product, partial [Meganyctiphanes norvegica]
VTSAGSIKLVNDIEMMSSSSSEPSSQTPLLVVGGGKAYAIADSSPRKTIMSIIQKAQEEKCGTGRGNEIYWLRTNERHSTKTRGSSKLRVTFRDDQELLKHRAQASVRHHRAQKSTYMRASTLSDSEDDIGDYALLHHSSPTPNALPQPSQPRQEEDPRYVDRKQILAYRQAMATSNSVNTGDQTNPSNTQNLLNQQNPSNLSSTISSSSNNGSSGSSSSGSSDSGM